MPAIQSFTMTYDALNEEGTFSEGDTISGKVTLVLLKETTVDQLFVKAKGDADVAWSRKSGDKTYHYSAHKRYFKRKQFLIPESAKDIVVPEGVHVYQFSLDLPRTSMPSSFKLGHGTIVYKLEAKLSRSWRMDRKVGQELRFVSKSYPNLLSLMTPQIRVKRKELGLFSKGHATMEVTVDRGGYAPGETMVIVAKINNSSSSEMTPKFTLLQSVTFRAKGSVKEDSNTVHKVVDHCIRPQTQKDVRCTIHIPRGQAPSIQNCDILSVEYHLKVYLDISFAFDPEVMFPILIIPPQVAQGLPPGPAAGPYPAGAAGGPSNSDFPPSAAVSRSPYSPRHFGGPSNRDFSPPTLARGRYPVSPNSSRYGYPGTQRYSAPPPVYPGSPQVSAGPPGSSGGYRNPVPQQPSPYGSPFSSSSSSSVLHPPPTAPTFHPSPSAPEINPSLPPPPTPPPTTFNISPSAPTYNPLPSAPMMNTDFLSQSDEPPPAYSLLFPSSTSDNSDAK